MGAQMRKTNFYERNDLIIHQLRRVSKIGAESRFQFFQLGNEHSPAHHDLGGSQQRSEKKERTYRLGKEKFGATVLANGLLYCQSYGLTTQ